MNESSAHNSANQTPQTDFDLDVTGMHCAGCVSRVEDALTGLDGVSNAVVNLASHRARVRASVEVTLDELQHAVAAAGYDAVAAHSDRSARRQAQHRAHRGLKSDLMIAAALTLPVFIMEMGGHLWPPLMHWLHANLSVTALHGVQLSFITLVMAWPGRRFYMGGLPALWHRRPDMDSLVAIGTLAAWGYSTVVVLLPEILPTGSRGVYFEAAGVIICLILLGRYLEEGAKNRATDAVNHLLDMQARNARVLKSGAWVEMPVEQVGVGDVVSVHPGERIPLDGEVIEGSSAVHEALVSGEPLPVTKVPGDSVIGATLNTSGALQIRVTRIGEDTVLAQIIRMVENAQAGKLPVQKLADQITRWFVPGVLLIAAVTFAAWIVIGGSGYFSFALVNAVAVLIVACPCALGLATPISVVVATGRAAQLGILFQSSDALQTLSEVSWVAMDKTGTLTEGYPQIVDMVLYSGYGADQVLSWAAAVQSQSEHPLARAFAQAASDKGLALSAVQDFQASPGFGVSARVASKQVAIGSATFLQQLGVDTAAAQEQVTQATQLGHGVIFVAIEQQLAGLISVADTPRDSAGSAISELQRLDMKLAMISGDDPRTAQALADQLGIEHVYAGLAPAQKVAQLNALADSATVLFLGDGLNDAPALAQADVGMAMGSGTDLAIDSADVVLAQPKLTLVADAIRISRSTMRNIRQNLFWAFAYNILLIPLACGLLYPFTGWQLSPQWAAAAMALSSLCVVGNALRLRTFRAKSN